MAARCCSGHAEIDEDRRDLVDHHQRHVVRLHQISGVHQQVAGAAGNRRMDLAVAQVQLGGDRPRLGRLSARRARFRWRPAWRAPIRARLARWSGLVGLRFRDHVRFLQFRIPRRFRLGELDLRGVARQRRLRLRDRGAVAVYRRLRLPQRILVRPRIDQEQQIALWTFWPSVKATLSSWPATCDFTCTIAEASTVPTTRSSVGTDSLATFVTDTGTTGGPPAAFASSLRHPVTRAVVKAQRVRTRFGYEISR